jgi:hypothetical protein
MGLSDPEAEKLAIKFNEVQWQFCPAKFELEMGRDFEKDRVIPICKKEIINTKGGTATLWQLEVLEEFVGDKLRETARNSRYNNPNDRFGYVSDSGLAVAA